MKKLLFSACIVTMFISNSYGATQIRDYICRNGIATVGDSKDAVLQKCGQPAARRASTRNVTRYGTVYVVSMEEWVYDEGPNIFLHYVDFNGNEVTQIYSSDTKGSRR